MFPSLFNIRQLPFSEFISMEKYRSNIFLQSLVKWEMSWRVNSHVANLRHSGALPSAQIESDQVNMIQKEAELKIKPQITAKMNPITETTSSEKNTQ